MAVQMEYKAIAVRGQEEIHLTMNDCAADGWEIFAVTNGYHGTQLSPAGVTLYMRRPKVAAITAPTDAAPVPHKPRRNR